MHYNYYRTYNPETGRYMQSDPIGLAAGANTYNYVGGNPLNGVDPLGLQAKQIKFDPRNGTSYELKWYGASSLSQGLYMDGYIYTKKGRPVRASKFQSVATINLFDSLKNYNYNYHGLTFTNGQMWVEGDDVPMLLEDGFEEIKSSEVKVGDIGVTYDEKNKITHSFTIVQNYYNMFMAHEKFTFAMKIFNIRRIEEIQGAKYYRLLNNQ